MTINPSDVNDPITQILAGEEINMANFINTAGPNSTQRAKNIPSNPFSAAKFFHYIIKCWKSYSGYKCTKRIARYTTKEYSE